MPRRHYADYLMTSAGGRAAMPQLQTSPLGWSRAAHRAQRCHVPAYGHRSASAALLRCAANTKMRWLRCREQPSTSYCRHYSSLQVKMPYMPPLINKMTLPEMPLKRYEDAVIADDAMLLSAARGMQDEAILSLFYYAALGDDYRPLALPISSFSHFSF